jgi:hypothetical protein
MEDRRNVMHLLHRGLMILGLLNNFRHRDELGEFLQPRGTVEGGRKLRDIVLKGFDCFFQLSILDGVG